MSAMKKSQEYELELMLMSLFMKPSIGTNEALLGMCNETGVWVFGIPKMFGKTETDEPMS